MRTGGTREEGFDADRCEVERLRAELAAYEAALAQSEARLDASTRALAESVELGAFLESILNASNDCIKVLNPAGDLVFMNNGGRGVMEVDDFDHVRGCPWVGFWDGKDKQAAEAALAKARGGEVGHFAGYCKTAKGNEKYWDVTVTQVASTSNRPAHFLSISRDITVQREFALRQEVIAKESAHRVKNILTVVQSVAHQTLPDGPATESFSARLRSLATAQEVLLQADRGVFSLRTIIETALLPVCNGSRCSFEGDDLELSPERGLALSMAVHELATNAIKYGSLSNDEGEVAIQSTVTNGRLSLVWRESGGPPVVAPDVQGFGTRVITRNLEASFNGKVTRRFHQDGMIFELDARVA